MKPSLQRESKLVHRDLLGLPSRCQLRRTVGRWPRSPRPRGEVYAPLPLAEAVDIACTRRASATLFPEAKQLDRHGWNAVKLGGGKAHGLLFLKAYTFAFSI